MGIYGSRHVVVLVVVVRSVRQVIGKAGGGEVVGSKAVGSKAVGCKVSGGEASDGEAGSEARQ